MRKDGIQTRKRKPKKPQGQGGDREEGGNAPTEGELSGWFREAESIVREGERV